TDVVDVERSEPCGDARIELVVSQEFPEGRSRRREAPGHADAGLAPSRNHFSARRVLAADALDVAHPQLLERDDPCLFCHANSPAYARPLPGRAKSACKRRNSPRRPGAAEGDFDALKTTTPP